MSTEEIKETVPIETKLDPLQEALKTFNFDFFWRFESKDTV